MLLTFGIMTERAFGQFRHMKQRRQIDSLRFVMSNCNIRVQLVCASDHLFDGTEAELSHNFAELLCHESHEVNGMLRVTHELLAKLRILSCDTYWTCIQLTHTHHDTAQND